jgi:hypothetical protein
MAVSPLSLTALQRYLPGTGAYGATSPSNPVSLMPGAAGAAGGPAYVYPSQPANEASYLPNNNDALNKSNQDRANALMSLQSMAGVQGDARLKADLHNQAADTQNNLMRERMLGMISSSMSGGTGGSGGGISAPQIAAPIAPSNAGVNTATDAAQNAAYAKAKSRAGAAARSSYSGLKSELADSGLLGGGTQARGLVDRLAAADNPVNDVNVAQLGENATNARHNQDLGADMAKTGYQGAIAQRGQDLSAQQAERALAIQKQQSLLSLLSGAMTRIY